MLRHQRTDTRKVLRAGMALFVTMGLGVGWASPLTRAATIQDVPSTPETTADMPSAPATNRFPTDALRIFWDEFQRRMQAQSTVDVAAWLTPEEVEALQQLKPSLEEIERMLDAESGARPPARSNASAAPSGDPYGFTAWLNSVRAQYGLAPVGHDPNLASWAAANNAQQQSLGLGHHVMGPARRQNSAIGSAASIGSQWLASPPHAAALLDPTIRTIGIAGLGMYWTFNAQ